MNRAREDKYETPLLRVARTAVAAAALASAAACHGRIEPDAHAGPNAPAMAIPVTVAEAVGATITETSEYTGRVEAVDSVDVRARVAGQLERAAFREGDLVKKGDLLFIVDPRPYQAELARAEGALARAKADAELAQREAGRADELLKTKSISEHEWDTQTGARTAMMAASQVASADVAAASLNVEYASIRAPVAGRIGRILVTPGNLVSPTTASPLTTLVSVDPLYVYVDVEEARALRIARPHATRAGFLEDGVVAQVGFAGEDEYPHEARMDFIDNRVDPATGTLKIRLVIKNPDGRLTPGLFARVRLPEEDARAAVLVSDRAVGTDQDRKFVLVVDGDNKVQYRAVKLGPLHDGLRVVRDGVAPADRVVVRGLQRVRPGAAVAPELVTMASVDRPAVEQGPAR
jgi:RND family efflux transporter MFP subunit